MKDEKALYLGHRKRIKKKFITSLGKELHDYELLEILLFSAFSRKDTKIIAKKLLEKFGNLNSVINADIDHLKSIDGVGEGAIIAIKIVTEIIHRILKNQTRKNPILNNWQALENYATNAMKNLSYEAFRIIFLNNNLELIEDELINSGEVDFVKINTKLIAKKALILNSNSIILMHNHPSSSAKASGEDIKTTNEICRILKPLNIQVIDHLIISKNEIFSFKKEGLL